MPNEHITVRLDREKLRTLKLLYPRLTTSQLVRELMDYRLCYKPIESIEVKAVDRATNDPPDEKVVALPKKKRAKVPKTPEQLKADAAYIAEYEATRIAFINNNKP